MLYPLQIAGEFEKLFGKTRFQKLTFLIQKEAERHKIDGPKFKFSIYLHGPFSFQLNDTIADLVHDGLLQEGVQETRDGNYVYYYKLTKEGRNMLKQSQQKGLLTKTDLRLISQIVNQYRHFQLDQLVAEAYRQYGIQKRP